MRQMGADKGMVTLAKPAPAGNSLARLPELMAVSELNCFDEIIDVRSESEYAEDHIPGAINCPVLNDTERARVGTIYKQVSAFDAKRIGAALVSANIARHLNERFLDRPRSWRPLVYCWRGGGRSAALAHVLLQVGWRAGRLDGGYKAYRRTVIEDLATLPAGVELRVVCGMTGSGKSALLRAIERAGGEVLDLEALAAHRGSVLGNLPDAVQPSQKLFESRIWGALRGFSRTQPVYVEAESRRIGRLRVPEPLIEVMWRSPCVVLEAPMATRIRLLRQEYAHFLREPQLLARQLACLTALHGHTVISCWKTFAETGQWDELIASLLTKHYDPAYTRSTLSHYPALSGSPRLQSCATDDDAFDVLARDCLQGVTAAC